MESGRRRIGKSQCRGFIGIRLCREDEISNLKIRSSQTELDNMLNLENESKFNMLYYKQIAEPVNLQNLEKQSKINSPN